jgi:hypothetical protein
VPSEERYFLRLVHKSYMNGEKPHRNGFRPNDNDTDGISLYEASQVSAEELKQNARKPPEEYRVARLSESQILALGLTLSPTPGDLPGHHVIPEINTSDYKSSKGAPLRKLWFAERQDSLADLSDMADD